MAGLPTLHGIEHTRECRSANGFRVHEGAEMRTGLGYKKTRVKRIMRAGGGRLRPPPAMLRGRNAQGFRVQEGAEMRTGLGYKKAPKCARV